MKNINRLGLLIFILANTSFVWGQKKVSDFQLPEKRYSVAQLQHDFEILRWTLEAAHGGLYRHSSKEQMDSLFKKVVEGLTAPMSELEYFRHLVPLIDNIHDAHTSISLSKTTTRFIYTQAKVFPLDVRYSNGNLYVEKNFDVTNPEVPLGSKVISINGINTLKVIDAVSKVKSVDGFNPYPKYETINSIFWLMYLQMISDSNAFQVTVKDSKTGLIKSYNLQGVPGRTIYDGQFKVQRADTFSVRYLLDGRVALMSIPTFLDFDLYDQFQIGFKELRTRKIKTLIIDIRDNSGGYDELNTALLSYIVPRSFSFYNDFSYRAKSWEDLKFTQYDTDDFWNQNELSTIGKPERDKMIKNKGLAEALTHYMQTNPAMGIHKPHPDYFFSGDTYLLFNGRSASSGGEVPAMMHFYGVGTLVGEEANAAYEGTTAGVLTELILPETGLIISVPLIAYHNNVLPEIFSGRGAAPHFHCTQSVDDAIKMQDTALEFVLRLIQARGGY